MWGRHIFTLLLMSTGSCMADVWGLWAIRGWWYPARVHDVGVRMMWVTIETVCGDPALNHGAVRPAMVVVGFRCGGVSSWLLDC